MEKHVANPPTLFDSLQYGFSQIVVAQGSRQVHISGQVAWDAARQIIGKDDLRTQTFQSYENLKLAMESIGGTLANILSLRIYIVERVIAQDKFVTEAMLHFFPQDPPASSWIGVPALSNPDFLIEIEAFALLD